MPDVNSYLAQQEETELLRQLPQGDNRAEHVFRTSGSAGANNEKLARLLSAFDFAMTLLGWTNTTLTGIVTNYQASIDSHYHADYKDIATIEELDRRMAKRRSMAYKEQGLI